MSDTYRSKRGYRYTGETVEITQELTETQFREIERILGRVPERFKGWPDHFCFDPSTPHRSEMLCAHLREQAIAHTTEVRHTFAIEDTQHDRAGARK